jgi:hypothetical protein
MFFKRIIFLIFIVWVRGGVCRVCVGGIGCRGGVRFPCSFF